MKKKFGPLEWNEKAWEDIQFSFIPCGTSFRSLPKMTTIFITEKDFIKNQHPFDPYFWTNAITKERGINSPEIWFFNTEVREDNAVGHLMEDFINPDPESMHSPVLAKAVREVKMSGTRSPGGDDSMSGEWLREVQERMKWERQEGKEEGRQLGKAEASRRLASKLIQKGNMSLEDISELTGLAVDELKVMQ